VQLVEVPKSPFVCRNLVGGEWQEPSDVSWREIVSPYTGEVVGKVPCSGSEEVAAIVAKAEVAAQAWRQVPLKERTQYLFRFRELLFANIDRLSNVAALEAGKTVAEAKAGVLKGIEILEFALSLQNLDKGEAMDVSRGVHCETIREPLGVVSGVSPFNFPAMVPMWMFPTAVTLGNAFVLKPSEKVPMSACVLGELMIEAGYPAGVFSIVHGEREAVEAVVDNPGIKAVGFVGSTKVAKIVYGRAANLGKRSLCLGGAKNHLILVPDANPDVAIDGIVSSFIGCAGQRCMAASVLVAVGDCDAVIDKVVAKAGSVELGKDMGALIDKAAVARLDEAVAIAEKDGAVVRLDGRKAKAPAGYEGGHWMGPTIIDNAKGDWDSATRELFGPVITIVRVANLAEAIEFENANPYGNATSVFTSSGAVAQYVSQHATSGMVGVNIGVPVPREPFSFGGSKDSRFGVGDMTGTGGVELWSYTKKVTTKWELQSDSNWMS
jgi:malonate-semialdehyde dehydrogenase (acetylating)/methylmalonate-semialdehyde dehydrogenase